MIRAVRSAVAVGLLVGCGSPEPAPEETGAWMELYERKDYFRLRDELRDAVPEADPYVPFLRAAVAHAFNRSGEAETLLRELLDRDDVPGELRKQALFLRLNNLVRIQRYAEAARTAEVIASLTDPPPTDAERQGAANTGRLMAVLADVPPQQSVIGGPTRLDHGTDGRIPVRIEGRDYRLPFDTGANLSILMRSEAERLGLAIRPAGIEVGTSTDRKVLADLAVAARVEIGRIEYRHVVFLVFPDELLTFPGGHVIEGLVGFPLIEAMGEIRFHADGSLVVPWPTPERAHQNLALHTLDPLVRVGYEGEGLICRLDTGADDTTFYEPFHRRYPELFATLGEPDEVPAAGVGGIRTLTAHRLERLVFELGGNPVTLEGVEVYTVPIADDEANDLLCNIGRNALAGFETYAINFRSMSLTTR